MWMMAWKLEPAPRLSSLVLAASVAGCMGPSPAAGDAAASFTPGQVVEVVGAAPTDVPAGQCRTVQQTAWVTAVESVPLQATVELGPNQEGLACDVAWQRIQSAGEEKCRVNFGGSSLYRNGRLLPISRTFADCRCQEGSDRTRCDVSTTAQCGFETQQTQPVEVCN